jgi:hypothetical protein
MNYYYEFRYVKRGNKKVLQQRVGALTIERGPWWTLWWVKNVELTWIDWKDVPTIAEIKND